MTSQQLINVLQELTTASRSIKDSTELYATMDKYDMLFLGENFNYINTVELRHTLSDHFGMKISNEELNSMIPSVCDSIGMKYDAMFSVKDLERSNRSNVYCYQLILW